MLWADLVLRFYDGDIVHAVAESKPVVQRGDKDN